MWVGEHDFLRLISEQAVAALLEQIAEVALRFDHAHTNKRFYSCTQVFALRPRWSHEEPPVIHISRLE